MPGEGYVVAVLAGVALAGFGFLLVMAKSGAAQLDAWPGDEPLWVDGDGNLFTGDYGTTQLDMKADALVPEYAAARRCPCGNCRVRRNHEPCSDYDGD